MNRFVLLVTLLICLSGCKKIKEDAQERAIMEYITSGQWKVSRYKFVEAGTDKTRNLSAFNFQFKSNETVDALRNGVVETTGIWKGNRDGLTIYAHFTTTDSNLLLLNATWILTKANETFVEATATFNGETRTIRLEKI